MANEHLAKYLNDHLAGATAGLELLEHLQAAQAGTPAEHELSALHDEVSADRQELEALMARLQVAKSRTRQATAWFAEKGVELKLHVDDPGDGAFRVMEALEALSLGIEGKELLWQALAVAAATAPVLQLLDYERLAQRAREQRSRVEAMRVASAKAALLPSSIRP